MSRSTKVINMKLETLQDAEKAASKVAKAKIEEDKLRAELKEKLKTIQEGYEAAITGLVEAQKPLVEQLSDWATTHLREFTPSRSIQFTSLLDWLPFGLLEGWTWDKVLKTMEAARDFWGGFLRIKKDIDKTAILKERDSLHGCLHKVGIEVVREETFYVEPTLKDPPAKKAKAA